MQDIIQDFLIWLLKFLAVSAGVLMAARVWTVRRRKKRLAEAGESLTPAVDSVPMPTWRQDAVLARMMLLLVISVSALFFARQSFDGVTDWRIWVSWGTATLVAGGLVFFWLSKAKRGSVPIAVLRQLADLFDLAALRASQGNDFEMTLNQTLAFHWEHRAREESLTPMVGEATLSTIEELCGRVSADLKARFQKLNQNGHTSAGDLKSFSNELHRTLEAQALSQARRVSAWGKYPLLASVVPVICLMLISPFSEWALDHLTGKAKASQSKPAAAGESQASPSGPDEKK